jgi:propionyl-CoA carboxylase alpha chain
MGSKLAAKEAVKQYISMVPGLDEAITDIAEAKKVAARLILDKSLCWWRWKRNARVENEAEFESQMNRAISEALNAFLMVLFLSKSM